jgi:hypothetical protein
VYAAGPSGQQNFEVFREVFSESKGRMNSG